MKFVAFANIFDPRNLGDSHCNPGHLTWVQQNLPHGWAAVPCDFRAIPPKVSAVIFGGGGMLHPGVDLTLAEIAKVYPSACWGIGLNYHHEHGDDRRKWKEALVAMTGPKFVRDPGLGKFADWAPCPSCLDPRVEAALMKARNTPAGFRGRPLIIEHHQHPIGCPYELPRIKNDCSTSFDETLARIGQASSVITNTFHGGYWSLLLGVQPYVFWGGMFSTRHRTLVDMGAKGVEDWDEVLPAAPNPLWAEYHKRSLEAFARIRRWLQKL